MATKREKLDPLDEVARLLALSIKRERGLQEVIVELDSVGIQQARIAEFAMAQTTLRPHGTINGLACAHTLDQSHRLFEP